jgi:hypothetical protein
MCPVTTTSKVETEAHDIDRALPHCRGTQNVEIYGKMLASSDRSSGIFVVDIDRTLIVSVKVANLYVHDNVASCACPERRVSCCPTSYDASANNRFAKYTFFATEPPTRAGLGTPIRLAWGQ